MRYSFLRFPGFRDKAVTVSYDDGSAADEKLISILSTYGIKGTYNINSARLKDEMIEILRKRYLENGNEIAIHGANHLPLAEVTSVVGIDDILRDKRTLESWFSRIIVGMAYAEGSYDCRVLDWLKKCGIGYARTCESTHGFALPEDWLTLHPTCHHNDPTLMELARQFAEGEPARYYHNKTAKMFYLWGHAHEFDNNHNWDVIENFAAYMGRRENIWYATNGEIYQYVQAYHSLVFSAAGDMVYNPSATDIYLNYFEKEQILPAGQTVLLRRGF